MLKLLCSHCYKSVSVPESAAGTDYPCPECGKSFAVPARYTPVVPPTPVPLPPPPPPPAPEASVPAVTTSSAVEPVALPAGYTHARGFVISPCVVAWIPTAALSVVLLLTFSSWVGIYPGGHPVYTQGAWRAVTGVPQRSIKLEELLIKDLPPPSLYDRTSSDWYIMLPYLLTLMLTVVLAWAERLDLKPIADRMRKVWPYRHAALAGLAGIALMFLIVESTRGFGLERAMHDAIAEKYKDQRQAAGASPGEQEKIDFRESQELSTYALERTGWFVLAMTLHIVALLAMLGSYGLARRGNKPPPRIVIQY